MHDWWNAYPWRLIQTNLREIDMQDIRAGQVVQDLRAFKATVLMINAAGIIASYRTKLPYHFQSPYLTGDSLLAIIEACHTAGMRVIARTDFSKIRRPIYEEHPEWAYRSARGEIVDYNGDIHVCVNSWYQQEGILHILDECFTSHPFDGVFFNMGGFITSDYSGRYFGPCHCLNCQRRFVELYGEKIPALDSPGPVAASYERVNPAVHAQYADFKQRILHDQEEKVYRFLSERYPHLCIANHRAFRRGFIRQESNTALDRPLPLWQYSASDNTRWAVGSYPEMVSSNTSVDFIDFPYRHVAVSPHEQALRLAQNLANGGALDFYLIGRLDNHADRSGFDPIKTIFAYHTAHEADYTGLASKAEIALLKPLGQNQFEYRGWFRVLVENHILFDVLTVDAALQRPWRRYQAILLPGITQLTNPLAQELDAFVAAGGTLVASGEAGFHDETGAPQSEPALKCLGLTDIRNIRSQARSVYFQVLEKSTFPRLAESDLVFLEGSYIDADYVPEAKTFLKLIPPHPYGPPERCYCTQITELPGLVFHTYGRGKSLYLPWLPGTQFYRFGHLNTFNFLADTLEHIAGLKPLGGNIPPQVEATLFTNAQGAALLHLVNTSGHFGNSYHPPLALTDLTIDCPWSEDPPQNCQALLSGVPLKMEFEPKRLRIYLPRLELFEAIRIR
jgi:hypothetical protein